MPAQRQSIAYDYLINLIANTQSTNQITDILSAILSDKEQLEIANRVLIFALLQQGLPQREIAERLGVGIATVSRGAKAYSQHQVAELLPNLILVQ
ncbi:MULTISPECIES: Trp family transcriptional regulator [unclassified Moraxella]|uniref:Trp family transcriptional regulator n=1 Tax=unclassified Moraxella TaxID=2685852 RepID=UPI003AF69687